MTTKWDFENNVYTATYSCDHNTQKCDIHCQPVIYLLCSIDLSNCNDLWILHCVLSHIAFYCISFQSNTAEYLVREKEKKVNQTNLKPLQQFLGNQTLQISYCYPKGRDLRQRGSDVMKPPGTWLAFKANQDLRENVTLNKNHKRHQTMLWTSVKLQSEAGP